jgi:hypothetical protein
VPLIGNRSTALQPQTSPPDAASVPLARPAGQPAARGDPPAPLSADHRAAETTTRPRGGPPPVVAEGDDAKKCQTMMQTFVNNMLRTTAEEFKADFDKLVEKPDPDEDEPEDD